MIARTLTLAAGVAVAAGVSQAATLRTVGTYDAATNANYVDTIASASDANGVATSGASDTLLGFKTRLATAFAANSGGVVDFDGLDYSTTPATPLGNGTALGSQLNVQYGTGQAKTLAITSSEAVRSASYGSATAVSGLISFDDGNAADGFFKLNFGAISGGAAGEGVLEVGMTVLSRTSNGGTTTMTVTYDDSTTASLSSSIAAAAGTDDTLFLFVAPAGRSISSLEISGTGGRRPLDDFAFITGQVPEPTAVALVGLAAMAALGRRRAQ